MFSENAGSAWIVCFFRKIIFWIFEILKHSGTPQNTDSHRYTRPPSWGARGSLGHTLLYNALKFFTIPHCTVPYNTKQYLATPTTIHYLRIPLPTILHNTMPYNTIQYFTLPRVTSPFLASPYLDPNQNASPPRKYIWLESDMKSFQSLFKRFWTGCGRDLSGSYWWHRIWDTWLVGFWGVGKMYEFIKLS